MDQSMDRVPELPAPWEKSTLTIPQWAVTVVLPACLVSWVSLSLSGLTSCLWVCEADNTSSSSKECQQFAFPHQLMVMCTQCAFNKSLLKSNGTELM